MQLQAWLAKISTAAILMYSGDGYIIMWDYVGWYIYIYTKIRTCLCSFVNHCYPYIVHEIFYYLELLLLRWPDCIGILNHTPRRLSPPPNLSVGNRVTLQRLHNDVGKCVHA